MTLDAKLEALLFFKGEGITISDLAKMAGENEEDVAKALETLKAKLEGRGVALVEAGEEVMLRTTAEASALIEKIEKEELMKDLGKAGAETLAIVLYKGPISRTELEYIRGVNSTFILRNLLIRGLVERISNPKDQRSFLYKPTLDLLSFLGVANVNALPEFETVKRDLEAFAAKAEEDAQNSNG